MMTYTYDCPVELVLIQSQCCLDVVANLLLVHRANSNIFDGFLGLGCRTSPLCLFVLVDLDGRRCAL